MKYNIETLLEEQQNGIKRNYCCFWGHRPNRDGSIGKSCLSQWWKQPFTVEGITYPTAEHWMMAGKAHLFHDQEIWEKILVAKDPRIAKKMGRQVRNFDPSVWMEYGYSIVVEGNKHKFSQHPELKEFLLNTQDSIIVEASPYDRVWGIGMAKNDRRAMKMEEWKGRNLLGFALMEVRDYLAK